MSKRIGAIFAAALAITAALFICGCASSEEYVPQTGDPTVSEPVINEDGVLRVGVNIDKSPLAGKGNDKIIGIDVDIAAALADELGLKVEVVDVGNDPEKALADNEVDIVTGIDGSDNTEFWLSKQYLPTGIALFMQEGQNPSVPEVGTTGLQIAAQGSSKSAWAVSNQFGAEALVSTNDLATAFADLKAGSVQYVASDAVIGMYAANLQGIEVQIVALLENASGYCIGAKKENQELQTAVTEALDKLLQNGTISVIEEKWLGGTIDLQNVVNLNAKATNDKEGDSANTNTEDNTSAGADSDQSSSNTSTTN